MKRIWFLFGCMGMLSFANVAQTGQLSPEFSKLGPGVNSAFMESHPVISPDGKTLFFSRKNHPQNIGEENLDDIWVSYLQADSSWTKAVNVGVPLNNKEANAVVAVDPSGTVLYLTDVYQSDRKEGVAVSRLIGRSWSFPERLAVDDFYNQSPQAAYHLSVDGRILLMSVQREEGLGKRDLYVSFENWDGEWTKPLNLGTIINTVGDEGSVLLAADGKTIFFSSDWHSSFGGFDLFVSRRLDDSWTNWSEPKNLGRGINTPGDDCCISMPAAADSIFFASSAGGQNSDLVRAALPPEFRPEPVVLFNGTVLNGETRKPLEAELVIQNLDESKNFKRLVANKNGHFELVLPYGSNLSVTAEKAGFIAISEWVELGDEHLEEPDFSPLNRMASGNADSLKFAKLEIDKLQVRVNGLALKVKKLEAARKEIRQKNSLPFSSNALSNDPKLDDLREEFDKQSYQNKLASEKEGTGEFTAKGTTVLEQPPLKIDTVNHFKGVDALSSRNILETRKSSNREAELADLKRNYYRSKGLEVPSGLQKNEKVVANVAESERTTFESLEREVNRSVERENYVEIKKDLQKDLLGEIKNNLSKQLNARERKFLKNSDFDRQLNSSFTETLKEEVQHRFSEAGKAKARSDWEKKLEGEMKKILSNEIKEKMRRSLKQEVRRDLSLEVEYRLAIERQKRLLKELTTKLQKQKLPEQKRKKNAVSRVSPPKEKEEKKERVFREIDMNIGLVPIKPGQVIPLNSVFFEVNQTTLKPASFTELNRLLTLLQSNPGLTVEFGVHANGDCTYSFAEELTSGRAAVLADFFIKNGIPERQIRFKGYGRTQPIASNNTLAGRKENQRVELMILKTE